MSQVQWKTTYIWQSKSKTVLPLDESVMRASFFFLLMLQKLLPSLIDSSKRETVLYLFKQTWPHVYSSTLIHSSSADHERFGSQQTVSGSVVWIKEKVRNKGVFGCRPIWFHLIDVLKKISPLLWSKFAALASTKKGKLFFLSFVLTLLWTLRFFQTLVRFQTG